MIKIQLGKFPNLKVVNLTGNPLSIYPKKCRSSWPKLKEYLESISKKAENFIGKKIIFVGDSKTGKTTLLKSICKRRNKANTKDSYSPTKGISTKLFEIEMENSNQGAHRGSMMNGTSGGGNNEANNSEGKQKVTCEAWDISGDIQYSATRNFFLTSKAIYILCFNLTEVNEDKICCWLQLIQTMCKTTTSDQQSSNFNVNTSADSFISPVFLVGTHLDDKKANRNYIEELESNLTELFPKICFRGFQGLFPVSCKTGEGVKELINSIGRLVKLQMEGRKGIATSWMLLLENIISMKYRERKFTDFIQSTWNSSAASTSNPSLIGNESFSTSCNANNGQSINSNLSGSTALGNLLSTAWNGNNHVYFMNWDQFSTLGKKCGIQKSVLPTVTNYLKEIGCILYLNTNYWGNNNIIILQPHWLHEVIHCLLHSNPSPASILPQEDSISQASNQTSTGSPIGSASGGYIRNGFLLPDDIPKIMSKYSPYVHEYVISLLSEYNILLRMKDIDEYLIPSLLPVQCPGVELDKAWPTTKLIDELEQQRIYEFSFLPLEFFSRVMVRLLRIRGVVGELLWKTGLVISLSSADCTQKCILTYDDQYYKLFIRFRIPTNRPVFVGTIGKILLFYFSFSFYF